MKNVAEEQHSISARSLPHRTAAEASIIAGGCQIWANSSITCPDDVYRDPRTWKDKKERLDSLIKKLRQKLDELKGIRRHLKKKRPAFPFANNLPGPLLPPGRTQQCRCDFPEQNDFRYGPSKLDRREERQRDKEDKLKKKERKLRRKAKFENTACNAEKMNCFSHDNGHWKTPPLWTYGPFCFCQNSNNNTYWCLRTINDTHNFLYCEFITGYITYYDLKVDPYQLRNSVYDLDFTILEELRRHLSKLKNCRGGRECNHRYKSEGTGREAADGTRVSRRRHRVNIPNDGEASYR